MTVPKGSTAYQSNDGRYYGRSEYEVKYLPDHEVRLRMRRGRVALAAVHLRLKRIVLGANYEAELREKYADAIEAYKSDAEKAITRFPELFDLIQARYHPDEISFDLILRNDGELTIREPSIEFYEIKSEHLFNNWKVQANVLPSRINMSGEVIYPSDERVIDGSECTIRCKRDIALGEGIYEVQWKVFLDNSPPNIGKIDIGSEIHSARTDIDQQSH